MLSSLAKYVQLKQRINIGLDTKLFIATRKCVSVPQHRNRVARYGKESVCCRLLAVGVRGFSDFGKASQTISSKVALNNHNNNNHRHYNDNNNNNPLQVFLQELEDLKLEGDFKGAIRHFNEFQTQNPDWVKHWPSQRIAASILHMYHRAGLHVALLDLYSKMCDMGLQHGEGIYSTVIKSCLAVEDWERALEYFEVGSYCPRGFSYAKMLHAF